MSAQQAALTSPPTGTGSSPIVARAWRVGLSAGTAALGVNLGVLFLARGLGTDMLLRVAISEPAVAIGVVTVTCTTLAPLLVATLLLLLLRPWGTRAWRVLAAIGMVFAVVTVAAPFTVDASRDTQMALACMHLAAGAAWFITVRRATVGEVH